VEKVLSEPRKSLRLLSYNVQTGIATTRMHHYFTQSWKHVLPHAQSLGNLGKIARLISEFDMVALQEVDAGSLRSRYINQAEYMANSGQFPFWYCQTNRNLGRIAQNSSAFLSKFRPSEVTEHKLPGLPGRGAMLVRYGNKGPALVLLLIHLALGQRARLRQLGYISELVNEHEHVVLMGDLNCQPESREMDILFKSTRLREPAEALNTFPSWRPQRNIDHILVTPSLKISNVRVLSHPFSDHLPIAVELIIPENIRLTSV
jgi:endonuclease/exonuclease/phosphatase family metal-dependent hydrolase